MGFNSGFKGLTESIGIQPSARVRLWCMLNAQPSSASAYTTLNTVPANYKSRKTTTTVNIPIEPHRTVRTSRRP